MSAGRRRSQRPRALFFSSLLSCWDYSIFLERETRFELATSTLARSHSTTELFPLTLQYSAKYYHRFYGLQLQITQFFKIFLYAISGIVGNDLRLKSVSEQGDFLAKHRNNIKPVCVLPKIIVGYKFLRRTMHDLLLLPVHKLPWFPIL
jgi:hypothetical protein